MSFNLGKDTSFNPPPPPKKRMSPWAVTGIGCAVLLVGAVIGISTMVVGMSNAMKEEMKKPIVKEEILADLGDTPLYPKIQFDEQMTKAGRAGMKTMSAFIPAQKFVVAGFRTDDSTAQVYAWYDEKLAAQGYRREEGRGGGRGGRAFRKGKDMLMVQANRSKGESNAIVLMRFVGMTK